MAIVCNSIASQLTATMPSGCATFSSSSTHASACGASSSSASCNLVISGGTPPYTTTFSYPQTPVTLSGVTFSTASFGGGSGATPTFGFGFSAPNGCSLTIYGVLQVNYTVTDSMGQTVSGSAQYDVNISRSVQSSGGGSIGGGGGGGGCVSIHSNIFGNGVAASVNVGDEFVLTDPYTNESEIGLVTYSEAKLQPMVVIETASGAKLTCSHSAPIPTEYDDYVDAIDLLGQRIPVANIDNLECEDYSFNWDEVVQVTDIGNGYVQHISVEDRCFWASDDDKLFILHHNKNNDQVNQQLQ